MESGPRCANCRGPLTRGDPVCPWCGYDPDERVEKRDISVKSLAIMITILILLFIVASYLVLQQAPSQPDYGYTHARINLSSPVITNRSVDSDT